MKKVTIQDVLNRAVLVGVNNDFLCDTIRLMSEDNKIIVNIIPYFDIYKEKIIIDFTTYVNLFVDDELCDSLLNELKLSNFRHKDLMRDVARIISKYDNMIQNKTIDQ